MSPLVRAVCVGLLLMAPSVSQGFTNEGPSESECRPFIEKALQGASTNQAQDAGEQTLDELLISETEQTENVESIEAIQEETQEDDNEPLTHQEDASIEVVNNVSFDSNEEVQDKGTKEELDESQISKEIEDNLDNEMKENEDDSVNEIKEDGVKENEDNLDNEMKESESLEKDSNERESMETEDKSIQSEVIVDKLFEEKVEEEDKQSTEEQKNEEIERRDDFEKISDTESISVEEVNSVEEIDKTLEDIEVTLSQENESIEKTDSIKESNKENEVSDENQVIKEESNESDTEKQSDEIHSNELPNIVDNLSEEEGKSEENSKEENLLDTLPEKSSESETEDQTEKPDNNKKEQSEDDANDSVEKLTENIEKNLESKEIVHSEDEISEKLPKQSLNESQKEVKEEKEGADIIDKSADSSVEEENKIVQENVENVEAEAPEEEELIMAPQIPEKLRSRDYMAQILRLDKETEEIEKVLSKTVEQTLKELKKLYETAIKPLEILYKYRDLSNRHFGDPEIFSKPLILFMGPWSGGKSTIINYLLENEYKQTALRTGADPSPAYFNIVMWGENSEILDGTQLAADWTFSGLQKFGQGLLDRLRGLKLNHPLLQKVNVVEIPGILEIRKQVERLFPFNDACQWFIDRADIIFLVYDPSKLDIGPETEAILDQLKGREMQTRIVLNKADQVKPEELMRVQGTLIWNISPLMSSTEPPVMYSTSLWSIPYEAGSPARLLLAQEKAFLSDLRSAIDKRVENKIAGARRFAVRVRNHAKMVDCYLTTYYNHKSFFDNKKHVSDDIIEHPQNYHIYEGLSTLTNISRYDLPDPDVYRDFFRLNPVYEFQQLSATCTYFRGCPINKLDLAIAYDLPELIGKYKKSVEQLLKSFNSHK